MGIPAFSGNNSSGEVTDRDMDLKGTGIENIISALIVDKVSVRLLKDKCRES